jgi:phage shock protein A
MGIWDRFSTMFRSNLNDLISRAENPEKMLNQLIVDMKTQLGKAKQQVASAIADEKKLQADAEALRKQAEDWERRAMLAVQEGKDDLAKQALMRYNESLQGAQQLHETWLKHRSETEKLKLSLRQLNDKIEEAKRKKNILLARAKRAEAQQRIQETMSGMSDKGAFESFERMAEKIEAQERKAIASAELQEEFEGDSLIKQFEVLEYHGTADQALIELKRKMGVLPPASADKAKQLGRGAGDVHDAELVDDTGQADGTTHGGKLAKRHTKGPDIRQGPSRVQARTVVVSARPGPATPRPVDRRAAPACPGRGAGAAGSGGHAGLRTGSAGRWHGRVHPGHPMPPPPRRRSAQDRSRSQRQGPRR